MGDHSDFGDGSVNARTDSEYTIGSATPIPASTTRQRHWLLLMNATANLQLRRLTVHSTLELINATINQCKLPIAGRIGKIATMIVIVSRELET